MAKTRMLVAAPAVLVPVAAASTPANDQASPPHPPKLAADCVRAGGEIEAETVDLVNVTARVQDLTSTARFPMVSE